MEKSELMVLPAEPGTKLTQFLKLCNEDFVIKPEDPAVERTEHIMVGWQVHTGFWEPYVKPVAIPSVDNLFGPYVIHLPDGRMLSDEDHWINDLRAFATEADAQTRQDYAGAARYARACTLAVECAKDWR